ncbi:hypothetical protein RND71_025157 [Anisodus tanguticus]|uniref:Uncharacterized protein n=1 Tax=Anisodus tanguticus TaxID=243964 RepID=A0AAE1VA52_9SOLA|nr:hypothetical protein RND71_025157 [Anisodus tanguticus]
MLKKGVFGHFMELSDLHLFDNILHFLLLSQLVSSNDSVLKFKVFDYEVIFDRDCFHLITGLDCCASDFSVVYVRSNRLLNRYFPNEERIKLSDLRRFLQFHSSHRASEFWKKYSDVLRLDVGTLGFDWLARSLRGYLRSLETMPDGSHCNYRFKTFVVNDVVATDQEMEHFPVVLCLVVHASSSSSGAILPRGLIDHLIDNQLDDERFAIVNQITDFRSRFDDLDTRFKDSDSRFVGLINVVENLVQVHDESKSFVGATESVPPSNVVCKSGSTTNESFMILQVLCDTACTPNDFSGKTETLSQIKVQFAKEKEAEHATYHTVIVAQLVD